MSLLRHHVVLMFIYAVCAAAYFTLLWKWELARAERIRFFFFVFGALFVGGIVLGWVMFPFPLR
ncbi:MAG TPA: hypothetical protein VF824_02910 [Thermoanaerobaculia bacterium]